MTATHIYDAVRTPFGRAGGTLSGVRPDDLAATVMRATIDRTGIDPARIEDVIFGDANQAGEDNRNVARFGALLAGFPTSVPGVTVNRLCASAVEAVIQGSRAIESGDADIVLAGGVESMSRAPFVVEKSPKPWPAVGNQTLWNTSIGWRMVNRALPKHWTISNGEAAEKAAREGGITREAQDEFSARSHRLAAEAWAAGVYDGEIVQVEGHELTRDEGIRDNTTVETLAGLKALFASDGTGTVTAGNSSSINDGASAVLLGREGAIDAEPLARITGRAAHGVDPDLFPIAPIEAANKALARAGRFEEAARIFESLLAIDPDTFTGPLAYNAKIFGELSHEPLAACYFKLGMLRETETHYARASALDPGNAEYKTKLMLVRAMLGRAKSTA